MQATCGIIRILVLLDEWQTYSDNLWESRASNSMKEDVTNITVACLNGEEEPL